MRILVCFKVLPEFETVLESDWKNFTPQTDITYARRALNCFDASALEIALRIKDTLQTQGKEVLCHAATLGTALPAFVRKMLYAVGFGQVILLQAEQPEFASTAVAEQLAGLAREGQYDMILTGKQAGYADTGKVPYLLAEQLRMPILPEVQMVEAVDNGMEVTHQTDAGLYCSTIQLPAILSVGNSPVNAMRAATLLAQLQAAKVPLEQRQVTLWEEEVPRLSYVQSEKTCTMLPEDTVASQVESLYELLKIEGDAR